MFHADASININNVRVSVHVNGIVYANEWVDELVCVYIF